jgi:CRISPR-associated endonuclease/helicase Cas3
MNFGEFFKAATGHPPFRWQTRLYGQLLKGKLPPRCNIPTGLGKTSIIHIWLLALAEQLRIAHAGAALPRRLVYVVDRHVVVDQATEEAEELLARFKSAASAGPSDALGRLARCLAETGSLNDNDPFTVSTLRGQHADNRLWLRDPARPAIIIGTVDMIGSRLLFSGYAGLGRYSRSLHAALLAQDALVVLDEAHLCPSFVETLDALARQLNRSRSIKPLHVMLLSATQLPLGEAPSEAASARGNDFGLKPEQDLKDHEVARRLQAPKALAFLEPPEGAEPEKPDALAARMAAAAVSLARPHSAVVVFVSTVDMVTRVSESLKSPPLSVPVDNVLTLTGEMRGKERDELVKHHVFALFRRRHRDRGELSHPIFLVATAAAEVGINFDADHSVCDLVTLERMVQRLGRVNRFGDGTANIQVFLRAAPGRRDQADSPEATTLRLLQSLPVAGRHLDASPSALSQIINCHPEAQKAFAPRPPCPPLDEARLDDWSLTTISGREFARPQVSYWLRGLTPDNTPHTWLAWRADLKYAADGDDAARMAEAIPLRPAELAQVVTFRASDWIWKLRQRAPEAFAALLDPAGNWSGINLGGLPEKKDIRARLLLSATVVLPAGIGGLKEGVLADSNQPVRDAVDTDLFQRVLLQRTAEGWAARALPGDGADQPLETYESIREARRLLPRALGPKTKFLWLSGPEEGAMEGLTADSEPGQPGPVCRVAYFASPDDAAELALSEDFASLQPVDVPLDKHNATAADMAGRLTAKLGLPATLAGAVVQACARHDLGKKQPQWQKAIGNANGAPLAKSSKTGFDRTATSGYRHEFGSLLEATRDSALAGQPQRDLILHLIAAHHGHARPGFAPEAFEILPLQCECRAAVREAELRFARLQREFGWWQLAYLESLVKCADALASAQSNPTGP